MELVSIISLDWVATFPWNTVHFPHGMVSTISVERCPSCRVLAVHFAWNTQKGARRWRYHQLLDLHPGIGYLNTIRPYDLFPTSTPPDQSTVSKREASILSRAAIMQPIYVTSVIITGKIRLGKLMIVQERFIAGWEEEVIEIG